MKRLLLFIVLNLVLLSCLAQVSGVLDMSFGNAGVYINTMNTHDALKSVNVQLDQRILACGVSMTGWDENIVALRLLENGLLDTTFGEGGIFFISSFIESSANKIIQKPNGKILIACNALPNVAGLSDVMVVYCLLDNGTPDSSFTAFGELILGMQGYGCMNNSLTLLPDQSVLIYGYKQYFNQVYPLIYKVDSLGLLDMTFGLNGVLDFELYGLQGEFKEIRLLPNGNLLCAGNDYSSTGSVYSGGNILLVSITSNGNIDTTFGNNGIIIDSIPPAQFHYTEDIELLSNGNFIVGGFSTYQFGLKQMFMKAYDINGNSLPFFSGSTLFQTNFAPVSKIFDVEVASNDEVFAFGSLAIYPGNPSQLLALKINSYGVLDSSWGNNGIFQHSISENGQDAYASAFQANGNIILAGKTLFQYDDLMMARLLNLNTDLYSVNINHDNRAFFPNPVASGSFISLNDAYYDDDAILYNLLGHQLAILEVIRSEIGISKYFIPEKIPPGTYFLKGSTFSIRIIVF